MTTENATDERIVKRRKLVGKASRAAMDLHDIAEELPTNWQRIPEVADIAYTLHAELAELETELKQEGLL